MLGGGPFFEEVCAVKRVSGAAALALLALANLPASGEARAVDTDAVNKAVERGVAGLRSMQREDGTWPHVNIGATALAGLTLLECGVKADDRAVQAAALAVRRSA